MIKLTMHKPTSHTTEIRVEGRLDAESLKSLQDVVNAATPSAVTVDLSGLTSVDREGGTFLVRLREAGCRLTGGSMYINRLLEEV